jgi:hypothetical protein
MGGAVLTELALLGRVQTDDTGIVNGPRVTPAGAGPLPDPLLQFAYDTVAEKTQRVQPLLLALGGDLWRVVRDRLVDRGLLRREESRWLGVFRSTRWPADDERHEAQLRVRIRRVLEDGDEPDPRTAAIIGLLSASGARCPRCGRRCPGRRGRRRGPRSWSAARGAPRRWAPR